MSTQHHSAPKRPVVSGTIYLGLGLWILGIIQGWIPGFSTSWPLMFVVIGAALIVGAFFRKGYVKESDSPHPFSQNPQQGV